MDRNLPPDRRWHSNMGTNRRFQLATAVGAPSPFIWTAQAKDILEKVKRAKKTLDNPQSA